jgi:hypothetical protein
MLYISKKQTILIKTTKLIKMKRFISMTLMLFAGVVLLASCTKRDYYDDHSNDDESGIVTYISEVNSPYSIVKLDYDGQYAIIYSVDNDTRLWPEINDVLIGSFAVGGSRSVYNKTYGRSIRIEVDEFFRYENDAINAVIRREDSEGYVSSFKKNAIKLQRRSPVVK